MHLRLLPDGYKFVLCRTGERFLRLNTVKAHGKTIIKVRDRTGRVTSIHHSCKIKPIGTTEELGKLVMQKLIFNRPKSFREEDIEKIVAICKERGYEISPIDAEAAWQEFSDSMAASWLFLYPDADDVFSTVFEYCSTENI